MLKKSKKSYIIKVIILLFIVALSKPVFIVAEEEEMDFDIKPIYQFQNKSGRDPFEPRYKKELAPAVVEVDISTFLLIGITKSEGANAALFKSKSGNPFGYIFINGKLYGENERIIPDIAGEIKSDSEVVLVQGDREVLFKLSEDGGGPNIRPND